MPCYKPLIRAVDLNKWETALDGHKYHPAKIFSSNQLENYDFQTLSHYKYEQINCGQCIGCRLDYSRDWANRGYLESLYWKNNYFVTLTYDEDHVPMVDEMTTESGITFTELDDLEWKGILIPKDFELFIKNLRQIMKRKYNFENIRYMGCGEYGNEEKRPHYHFILFNCNIPTEDFYETHISNGNTSYKSHIIDQAWSYKGLTQIEEANWNTIAYVARYITKKINGKQSEEYYAAQGQIKEFFRTSLKPGIGYQYYEDHKNEIYEYDKILIKNTKGSHWVTPPKYYDRLYEREEPEKFKKIKKRRNKQQLNQLLLKGQTTSLTRWEQFQVEQYNKENVTKSLKRKI